MTEFNHIHRREEGDWICGRSLAFEDRELLSSEARDPEEAEACRRSAEQLLGYFGDALRVQ